MFPMLATAPERFEWARGKAGLSQEALAKLLNVSQQSIEKFENGYVKKPKYLPEAALVLGVPYIWLRDGTTEEDPSVWLEEYMGLSEPDKRDFNTIHGPTIRHLIDTRKSK